MKFFALIQTRLWRWIFGLLFLFSLLFALAVLLLQGPTIGRVFGVGPSQVERAQLLFSKQFDNLEITIKRYIDDEDDTSGISRLYYLIAQAKNRQTGTTAPLASFNVDYFFSSQPEKHRSAKSPTLTASSTPGYLYAILGNIGPGDWTFHVVVTLQTGSSYTLDFQDNPPVLPFAFNQFFLTLALLAPLVFLVLFVISLFNFQKYQIG